MRIVLASRWFPVGVGAYLLRAARAIAKIREDFHVLVVGPTTGPQCWTADFQYPAHAVTPDYPDALGAVELLKAHGRTMPDLWIDVDGGFFTDARMPWTHAIVATDPHIAEQGEHWTYKRQREVADFFFCMQKPYCATTPQGRTRPEVGGYTTRALVDVHLPYAYDEFVFKPDPEAAADAHVSVLGVPYPPRIKATEEFRRRGFRVLAGLGDVYEDYCRALHRAPVCFIWSLKDDVPCRVFEAAACGRAILVNDSIAPEIRRLLPWLKLATFDDSGGMEAALAAAEALEGLFERDRAGPSGGWSLRANAREMQAVARRAVEGQTWTARLLQVMRDSGHPIQ